MSSGETVKILMLGPVKSGKSTLANFLCGTRETPTSRYYETSPLRILETEMDLEAMKLDNRRVVFAGSDARKKRVVVQVWDVSGNSRHQAGWPAIANEADGIIFVYNPEIANSEKELILWHKSFALNQNELDEQGNYVVRVPQNMCLVFAHHSAQPKHTGGLPALPQGLEQMTMMETSIDYHSDNFKEAFDKLIERIVATRLDAEEERALQNDRSNADRPKLRA